MPSGPVEMITSQDLQGSINLVVCWPRTQLGFFHLTQQVSEQLKGMNEPGHPQENYFPRGGRKKEQKCSQEEKDNQVARKELQADY